MTPQLRSLLLAAGGAMVLMLGPLRAQEAEPPPAPAAEAAPPAADAPADDASKEAQPEVGEGLSADNSLSFPVDI